MTNSFVTKFYNKFYVGVLSIIVGFLATLHVYFLGFFLGLILLVGGIYAVIISKQKLWIKAIVLSLTLFIILWRLNIIVIPIPS